ncbi:pX [Psittacine adenovirus 3]|uniref:PX n=1 Tax=Psittacine adenovirus 3 TaxID=1580497 RepID=A0A0A7JTS4_9ADEN|nr:pX [Psittacine adenovirus 3]AIZ35771.1 pX [Psittacine adenovirus 3]
MRKRTGRSRRKRLSIVFGRPRLCRSNRRRLKGGFLPLLIPLISAAIGAAPAIASTVIAAKNARRH